MKLIGLHFEHLRCDRAAVYTAAGCLHQVYISSGGWYRLVRSSYMPELDLGNLAVLLAALGVLGTGTGWPDFIVAAIMAALALQGAWTVIRQSIGELRRPVFPVAAE